MLYDFDGSGERELICSAYTLSVYEQEFHKSMIADVYGVVDLKSVNSEVVTAEFIINRLNAASTKELPKAIKALINRAFPAQVVTKLDYSADNWEAYLRAAWAMMKTADLINKESNTPAFLTWLVSLGNIDMREVSNTVLSCMEDGLFHSNDARNQAQEG